jgi:HD superfamily phosphodiesterase
MTQQQFDFLYNKAEELMKKTKDPNHDWSHMQRVEENALKIKKLLPNENQNNIDDKILRLACAWHDISYASYKASPRQYFLEARRSVRVIKKYFKQVGILEDELKIIVNMVLYHDVLMSFRHRNGKRSLYNKIIQDADFLDGVDPKRVGKVREMAKDSLYWKLVGNILIPLFLGGVIKNKNKFLNLEESTRL